MAIGIAAFDVGILFGMSAGFQHGIGLAIIAVGTFFGMLMVSSYFEEHRHKHDKEGKSIFSDLGDDVKKKLEEALKGTDIAIKKTSELKKQEADKELGLLANVIAGRGILRKAIASSLIITYVIFLGLFLDNGQLGETFPGFETKEADEETSKLDEKPQEESTTNTLGISTFASNLILVQKENNEPSESSTPSKDNQASNGDSSENDKPSTTSENSNKQQIPKSLLEHFTIVITIVIGFYFGTDIAQLIAKSRVSKGKDTPSNKNKETQTHSKNKALLDTLTKVIQNGTMDKDEKTKLIDNLKKHLPTKSKS